MKFVLKMSHIIFKQTIHKRSQLDEEATPYRRPSRSVGPSHHQAYGHGGQSTFHHQNPILLRTLIDADKMRHNNKAGAKKRSHSNLQNVGLGHGAGGGGGGGGGTHASRTTANTTSHDKPHRSKRIFC